jgi:hypothetical protein
MSDLNFDGTITSIKAKQVLRIPIQTKEIEMSNYPPGVTGNEYEIAGPDREWEEEDWECTNQTRKFVKVHPNLVDQLRKLVNTHYNVNRFNEEKENFYSLVTSVSFYLLNYETDIHIEPCGYVGDIAKQSYQGKSFWTCPQCNQDYEKYEDDGYDYGYDVY